MKRINSLGDLLIEELADLLNAENKLLGALPKMVQACASMTLKTTLERHLEVTKDQAGRLKYIFSNIGQNPQEMTCEAMKGFIQETEDIVHKTEKCQARDTAITSVMQRILQYEIIGYQTACAHAADLGHTGIIELFNETLNEERSMNFQLNELSQGMINAQATSKIQSGGFYIPEGKYHRSGTKKKSKNTDVSRFISEGNPNAQEASEEGQDSQNPQEEDDLS